MEPIPWHKKPIDGRSRIDPSLPRWNEDLVDLDQIRYNLSLSPMERVRQGEERSTIWQTHVRIGVRLDRN